MKFKQMKGYEEYDKMPDDILTPILKARGVTDVKKLMSVSIEDVLNPFTMYNMENAVKLLQKHIENKSSVNILIDEDVDGFTSASTMYLYLQKAFPELVLNFTTNENKQHGIVMKRFKDFDFDLLIVPDAGSSDYKQHKELKEKGIDILVLDHHPVNSESEDALIVNPNMIKCEYENKHLSGVGVVYKFCQALDETFGFNYANDFLDLVALGMIGDSMDLRSYETRYLCLEGIKMMQEMRERIINEESPIGNSFINAIINKKKDRDLEHINFYALDWKVIPMINGCIRSGTDEEKINMFRAFIGEKEDVEYQPRRKNKNDPKPEVQLVSLQDDMVRQITNIKARQDKESKKAMEVLEERIIEKNLLDNKILFVDGTGLIENKSLSGLIAQKIASKYQKPCVILKKKDGITYGGSARNYSSMSVIDDLKQLLLDTQCFNNEMEEMGHPNAFGISINPEKLVEARDVLNDKLKHTEFELVYNVDFIIPFGRLKKEDVIKVGKLKSVWGNTIPCPRFAITNVKVPVSDVQLMGEKENVLKIKKGDFSFIQLFSNSDTRDRMILRNKEGFGKSPKEVVLDLICEFEINNWNDTEYPELKIVDFTSRESKEIIF